MISNTSFGSKVELLFAFPVFEHDLGYVAQVSRGKGYAIDNLDDLDNNQLKEREESAWKSLRFCIKAGHLSIFEFAQLVFRIECPIFVARQLMRYRNASYIERSLRYCEAPSPRAWELKEVDLADVHCAINAHEELSRSRYQSLIEDGERKELARAVLPLSTMTIYLMRVDLRELLHIFEERLTLQCQRETREVVQLIFDQTKRLFPITIEEWEKKRGV